MPAVSRVLLRAAAEEDRLKKMERKQRRMLREFSRPMLLPSTSFIQSFRLTKAKFTMLCEDIMPLLKPLQRSTSVRPEIKILATLQLYASGGYKGNVGNHNSLNLSQTTVSECVQEVTEALNSPGILRKYIHFPQSQSERLAISQRFMDKFGFPGVLGCIDGTHCAIIRPHLSEDAFFNRKHYHSLNAMVVCDADLRILYVDASYGGASHDSHVWNGSPLKNYMEDLHSEGHSFWFLGDSGYAQRPWMMTPILNATPNSPEEYFTARHCSARNVVERCFGVLKTRFRILLAHRVMHYDPVKAGKIVNACVVLHNLINDMRINIDEDAMQEDRRRQPLDSHGDGDNEHHAEDTRQALVSRLWRSHQDHRQQQ